MDNFDITRALRVFLVEDHHIMRRGLASLLSAERKIAIIGEAGNGEDALKLLARGTLPDLIIMDVSLPGVNGIVTTRQISTLYSSPKILMLSMYDNPIFVYQAMDAGASGYILKQSMVEELNIAISTVMAGKRYLSPQITQSIDPDFDIKDQSYQRLTSRELEVINLLSSGVSVKEIAEEMVISIYTVYTHINNIKRKIGIEKTSDLVRYAIENPLVLGSMVDEFE